MGLKATQQRLVIFRAIHESEGHPSAEIIFETVRVKNPSMSLATVYSTLDTFLKKGLIQKVLVSDGVKRFEGHMGSHNHIHCANTNEIIDFEDLELNQIIQDFLDRKQIKNLNVTGFSLHIQGTKVDTKKNIEIH